MVRSRLVQTLLLVLLMSVDGAVLAGAPPDPGDRINLALRRTADRLLRQGGDSTSRIPPVEQVSPGTWRIRLDRPFRYEDLPAILQASLDRHGIREPYEVAVRRCADGLIGLGYHSFDWQVDSLVPCGGREMAEDCQVIDVTFTGAETAPATPSRTRAGLWLFLGMALASGAFLLARRYGKMDSPTDPDMIAFGQSRLDTTGQALHCGDRRLHLTYRETKLLHLLATHPDEILDRDAILQAVWADEGILVGRSIDMFISRLRKKLAGDPTVAISAVHGVGYRLETGRVLP